MANNYRGFSEQIENLTDEEIEWLDKQTSTVFFKKVPGLDPAQAVLNIAPDEDAEDYAENEYEEGVRFLVKARLEWKQSQLISDFDMIEDTDFSFVLNKKERTLWIYAEEYGDVGQVAILVQQFLRKFRPNDCFALTTADYCAKPRIGEFGGVAVFVTAREARFMTTWDWIEEQRKAFKEAAMNVDGNTSRSSEVRRRN